MLQENLKTLRKNKGLTQEELAEKLHVVRQTVSKWEKGVSVPDAEMLKLLAETFEVSVSDLLGENIEPTEDNNMIAEQLSRINEQLIIKNRRAKKIWKAIVAAILAIIAINLVIAGAYMLLRVDDNNPNNGFSESTEIIDE